MRENKFLLFAFEGVRSKIAELQIDFPANLLDASYICQNKDFFLKDKPLLYTTISDLMEAKTKLEERLLTYQLCFCRNETSNDSLSYLTERARKQTEILRNMSEGASQLSFASIQSHYE